MSKYKKFKIYTHQNIHVDIHHKAKAIKDDGQLSEPVSGILGFFYYIGVAVLWLLKTPVKLAYGFCYHTGNILVKSVKFAIESAISDVKNTAWTFQKRWQKLMEPQFKNALLVFLMIAAISSMGFAGMHFVAKGLQLKGQVLGIAIGGEKNLLDAQAALKQQDFDAAQNKFALAYQSFSGSQQKLQDTDKLLSQLLAVLPQKRDADRLFHAAALLSRSGMDLIDIYRSLGDVHLTAQGVNVTGDPKQFYATLSGRIAAVGKNLDAANQDIINIDPNNIPKGYQDTFIQMKSNLGILQNSFSSFQDIYDLVQKMLLGDKNVLILFENNNELRATGGFMGTFGNLKVTDGKISKMNISSIYDLDGQLSENIIPPTPVLNVNNRWFLRDSNWFADFPESARKVTSFYEKEGGETPDLIIAMTPNIIVDLLKITGPVKMSAYGTTLSADNFIEQTQALTTVTSGPLNNPKQMLADFFPVLLQKISELPASSWSQVLQSLQDNLNGKQLVFYSRDEGIQDQLQAFNWAGTIRPSDRDYLSLVSSNLGGTKTDLYIDQRVDLKTSISDSGDITNELTITRTNTLPKLKDTANTSFIRVFVPAGSTLVSNTGFDYKDLDASQVQKGFETDPQVYDWERSSVKDMVTGTIIGKEAGKVFFGNWLTLEGGETKTVKLTYRLPYKLNDIDRYSLLLQKQMGDKDLKIDWTLDFSGYSLEWKNFDAKALETNSASSDLTLNHDYILGAVLKRR